MTNSALLIIVIVVIMLVVGGIFLATMDNKTQLKLAPYDHVLNRHGLMKMVKDKKIPIADPHNILLPDALPALKPEILAKVSVKTLQDTANLVNAVVMSMSIDLAHLQALSPDQIKALSPFQLTMIDATYGGPDGQLTPLQPLLSPDQFTAVKQVLAPVNNT